MIWLRDAYLEAKTCEKVCIKAGPESGKLAGKLLLINKALYGLRFPGRMFEELLADCLLELGFEQSRAKRNIWMRKSPKHECYKYVATYIDDICIIMKDPEEFLAQLESDPYNFKL